MKKLYPYKECLRFELFDRLIPMMLYQGTTVERESFFISLRDEGQSLIFAMLNHMCFNDRMECPYTEKDFSVHSIKLPGISIIQINLPEYSLEINTTLRVYILSSAKPNTLSSRLYFIIKRFQDGSVYILFVNQECQVLKIENITDNVDNLNYEHSRLVENYFRILIHLIDEIPYT